MKDPMFKTISKRIAHDKDYPLRQWAIDVLTRLLNGTFYDVIEHDFHEEENEAGEYIKIRDRRPSVRSGLLRTVVDDSVSLLFSEGHFPEIQCDNEQTREALEEIAKEAKLNAVMIEAATIGSAGSAAIWLRVLKGRVFLKALNTIYLTPIWRDDAPDTLAKVVELYKASGKSLNAVGYSLDEQETYWFRREWDETSETWFEPQTLSDAKDGKAPTVDEKRTVKHSLGFVPMVWIKNLPGGDDADGAPTFNEDAINTVIEVDYQLSQAGRGLKYSSDPTLLIKEPAVGQDGQIVKGGGNAIVVSAEGDAKMLEINGTAAQAVIEYVRMLREIALESLHGNRSSADKLSAAQSGRALELMHQALIWLADKLRISYGEGALLELLNMIVAASQKYPLSTKKRKIGQLPANEEISLVWPAWFAPTSQDRVDTATAVKTHVDSGTMSRETAVKTIAADYDIEDQQTELSSIEKDRAADAKNQNTGNPTKPDLTA